MAATLNEFVIKCSCIFFDGNVTKANKEKFNIIGCYYSSLEGIKNAKLQDINNLTTKEGFRCFNPLTQKEQNALKQLQLNINPNISLEENFIKILTMDFIRKQAKAIENITLEGLNANPLLSRALKLNTPKEFIRFYTYSALSRSIVTSMGYLVQDLLLYSNTNVYNGKDYDASYGTKWDIVIEKLDGVRSYIEVKSGPNDMDKTQILAYDKAIQKVLDDGEQAFLGITYGKKTGSYVSTKILETYVKNWEEKTLIGTELWDYISDNENYHNILMETIESTAKAVLGETRLIEQIEGKINSLLHDLYRDYGNMESFYNSLW